MQAPADCLTLQHAPQLLELIQASITPDKGKEALQYLEKWEQMSGYCSLLHCIIINKQINSQYRFIAISCFKNAVHKFWIQRNSKLSSISKEEKESIRSKLTELFNEEDNLNANHISLLYAKIARLDFPREWPHALQTLLELQKEPNITPLRKLRLLSALKFTVKALSTKVLMISRCNFQRASPEVLQYISNVWASTNQQIIQQLKEGGIPATESLEACKLSLQTLKPLLQYGIPKLNQNNIAMEVLSVLLPSVRQFIQFGKSSTIQNVVLTYIHKYVDISCKMVLDLHQVRPGPFEHFLVPYLELMWGELSSLSIEMTTTSPFLARLSAYCLRYIKDVIGKHYFEVPRKGSQAEELKREQEIIFTLFTPARMTQLAEMIISKFLVMTKEDLENWQSDPEEFLDETASADDIISPRGAAEALFRLCQSKFDVVLAPHILQLLTNVSYAENESMENILLRDACYQALGYSYDHTYPEIPFQSWFDKFFLLDLNHPNRQGFMILGKRIAWLLGCWVTRVPSQCRPITYQLLLKLMEDEDIVIQVTAAEGLAAIIDDLNFDIGPFASFVPPVITHIFRIIEKVEELPTKMQLISHLSVIIEQSGIEVFPFVRQILEYLIRLWNIESKDQGMMKSTILRNVEKLVVALEYKAEEYYDLLSPIIHQSLDISQGDTIYTLEDGMGIWLHLLTKAKVPHGIFMEWFDYLPKIIDLTFDHTPTCISILDCYILLGGESFLSNAGKSVIAIYTSLLGHINDSGTPMIIRSMKTLVECFPSQGPSFLQELLTKVISLLFTPTESVASKNEYLTLLVSVVLANGTFFLQLCSHIQQTHAIPVFPHFLDYIFTSMENISNNTLRHRIALVLGELLPFAGSELLKRLPQVIDVILSVQADQIEDPYGLDDYDDDDEEPAGSIVDEKRYQLYKKASDISKISVQSFLVEKMQRTAEENGPLFQQALQNTPSSLLSQLQQTK